MMNVLGGIAALLFVMAGFAIIVGASSTGFRLFVYGLIVAVGGPLVVNLVASSTPRGDFPLIAVPIGIVLLAVALIRFKLHRKHVSRFFADEKRDSRRSLKRRVERD